MTHQTLRPVEFLLVEDNPGDIRLTRESLAESKIYNHLNVVNDGVEALKFLRREGHYENASRPDVILLDLNLPKMSGHEVLADIKKDPALLDIPVVVLTASSSEEDIARSYSKHANCFITKPLDYDQFIRVVHSINDFWLSIVKLPQEKPRVA